MVLSDELSIVKVWGMRGMHTAMGDQSLDILWT
jgi:hypothetical protein